MKYKLSIIIPVYNEDEYIGRVLQHILDNCSKDNIEEIIIVDGGSSDNSIKIISEFVHVKIYKTLKGRARQLNHGANLAKGAILYFLHSDSYPPKDFDIKVINAIKQNYVGSFRLKFENPNHYLLKISQWTTRLNFSLFRGGDQSLYITKKDFDFLKGFNERYIIYEDIEFINRIYKKHNFKIIKDYVVTSERKFKKNGIWKLHFNFLMIHIKYWFGANPDQLYNYYLKNIKE